MKILFITSTIVSIIVITLLVVINLVYNKDITKNITKNITKTNQNGDSDTQFPQPTNTNTNTITNTNNTQTRNTLEKDTLIDTNLQKFFKCNKTFHVNKIIVYMDEKHVNKFDIVCNENKDNNEHLLINQTINLTGDKLGDKLIRKEFESKMGFSDVFIKKEKNQLINLIVKEPETESGVFLKYSCPNLYKLSGIIIDTNQSDLNTSLICIN
jgi:hypothetical protein